MNIIHVVSGLGLFRWEEQAWEQLLQTSRLNKIRDQHLVASLILSHQRRIALKPMGVSSSLVPRQRWRRLICRDGRPDLKEALAGRCNVRDALHQFYVTTERMWG